MMVDARAFARRPLRLAVGGAMVVATAFIPSAESVAADQVAEVELTYTCAFPAGFEDIAVTVKAALPAESHVGTKVQPRDVAVTLTIPEQAVAGLTPVRAASVSAVARLTVRHSIGDTSADASWAGLEAPSAAVPAEGDMVLTATGPVPTAAFGSAGEAALTPAGLSLSFAPRMADGSPSVPPGLDVDCGPAPGQEGTLATIAVKGSGPDAKPPVPPAPPSEAVERPDVPVPTEHRDRVNALIATTDDELEDGEDSCPIEIPPEWVMRNADTYAAGFANAAKMDGAVGLGPVHMEVVMNKRYINDSCAGTVDVTSEVQFEYQGRRQFPPAKSTFLTYGFMPTTATMELSQVGGPAVVHSHTLPTDTYPEWSTVTAQLSMRIYDVEVNGVPLDVGPDCRTATSFPQVLRAYGTSIPPEGYRVAAGGTLSGYAKIPAFKGCGVGEDLDAVFTAAISSAGKEADNYSKITQAPLCVEGVPDSPDCPPKIPKPER